MRKYYLFIIKKDYYDVYKKNPLVLYKTLENLYKLKRDDLNYGITLYNQICNIVDVSRLKNYFEQVNFKSKDNRFLIHQNNQWVLLDIHYSCIICKTIKNWPTVFDILNYYSKYIFVCDFYNKDYFFLNRSIIKYSNYKYNYS